MAVTVALRSVNRLNDSDSNTNWSNLGGGGPAPASEPQLRYQYSGSGSVGAVNRKVASTGTTRTGVQFEGGTARDISSGGLAILKGYVADYGDLNTTWGVEFRIGSASGAYQDYNVAGSGANGLPYSNGYPARGGYLIVAIDPEITGWREGVTGSPSWTAVDYAAMAAGFVVGGAKSENVALDAIDLVTAGGGLSVYGNTPDATFQDLPTFDEGTIANRYGLAVNVGSVIVLRGIHQIGRSTEATTFTDESAIVIFPNGYHSQGTFGINCDIQNASTVTTIGSTLISEGNATTEETRADFLVTGTSGSFDFHGVISNFYDVTFTSVCDVNNASIECLSLTQASADIYDSTITTTSLTSIATLQDPTFGSTTDLHDVSFIQGGAGHAIEITSAGTYDFNNLFFSGYGADTTDSAAIDVTAGSGTVTINVIGGDTPTYKTAGATVVIVANPVTLTITCLDGTDFSAISSARVLVRAGSTGPLPYFDSVTITSASTTATVSHTSHGLSTGQYVVIEGATQNEYNGVYQITVSTASQYTYTFAGSATSPATGTITSTAAIINGTTNGSGVVSDTRTYSTDQTIDSLRSRARKSSSADNPKYQNASIAGTIDSASGASITVQMVRDQ